MKIQHIIFLVIIGLSSLACSKDEESHDAKQQALDDDKAIITYLETHYLTSEGSLQTISKGETPIKNNIKSKTITENEIEYKLYYLTTAEGVGIYPKVTDSVYLGYSGMRLDSTVFDSGSKRVWFNFNKNLVTGFKQGVTLFKSGTKVINDDESFYYKDTGKGYIFMPSGLGYGNVEQSTIPKNSPLIFKIDVLDIKEIEKKDE